MTDQQKKAVEEAAESKYPVSPQKRDIFRIGAKEVLDNPEMYGLVSTESIESYKHQRDFYRNKLKELKGGKSVTDGLDIDDLSNNKIIQS